MKAFPVRKSTQQKVPVHKRDSRISRESSGRPKLFADTDYTAKLFNETSGRLDIDKEDVLKTALSVGHSKKAADVALKNLRLIRRLCRE